MSNKHRTRIEKIQAFVTAGTHTKTELATAAGVPLTTLIGMERVEWNPLERTVDKLEAATRKLTTSGRRPARIKKKRLIRAA